MTGTVLHKNKTCRHKYLTVHQTGKINLCCISIISIILEMSKDCVMKWNKSDIMYYVEHPFVSPFCQSSSHRDPGTCSHQRSPAAECTNRWCWRSRSPGRSSWAGAPGDAEPCRRRIWGLPLGLWYSSTPATTLSPSVTTSQAQTSGSAGRSEETHLKTCWSIRKIKMQYIITTMRGHSVLSNLTRCQKHRCAICWHND